MNLLKITLKHITNIFQFALVFLYLIFEELIWDRLIVPINRYISSLQILKSLEQKLLLANRTLIVVLFVTLFAIVEILGIVAAGIAINGNVIAGVALYLGKVPIAAFTFWMFGVVKPKLMTFDWFRVSYDKITLFIEWIKSSNAYMVIMGKMHNLKLKIKSIFALIKEQLPSSSGSFFGRVRLIYAIIKKNINK